MPGTIQVSVLDFKNTSSPSSSISLWVSMGKTAYQTLGKGDFSFPLTTFRENLVVKAKDAEGNEISRIEVKTLSIVEKGYWDDVFQLDGGFVHMKLQFVLTEDDRNRIRNVRESALKKTQEKVPTANVGYAGTAITLWDKIASSMPIKREISDRNEATSSSTVKEGVEIYSSEPDKPLATKLQTQLIRDYTSVKPVYELDAQSMLKKEFAAKKESVSFKKIVAANKPEDRPVYEQDTQSMLKTDVAAKRESVSLNKIVDSSNKPENQGVLQRTPSSVRKMISAFETGLAQKKGRRSLTRTRASKSQPNLVGIGRSLKDLDPKDTGRPNKMSALRLENNLTTGNLPEPQRNIGKRGESSFPEQDIVGTEQPVFHEQLTPSSAQVVPSNEAGSSQQEALRSDEKESNTVATSPVDLMRLSGLETATSSQTINVAHSDMPKANNIAADQDHSNDPSAAEKQNRGNRSETVPEIRFERASSNEKPSIIAYCKNEHYDSESSGAWIFPDNEKHLCMTTAGKSIVHLLEDCRIGVDDHQRMKRPSTQETTWKRGFFHRNDSVIKKERENPQNPRKSQSESSGKNGPSGPVRQVIKIAVIVGFGILVLLTRQKETRKSERKSKDIFFASPDFMDQLASSEEQWRLRTADGD